jgi:peptidoglycan/xylan/chitin deacetylase (PgdA/CDA1 family)
MGAERLLPVAALAAWCAPAAAPVCPPVARLIGVPTRLPEPRGIALTFDDGPHREGTPAVLEALRDAGATATFFLTGEQVERLPSLAGEIAAAGHAVGIHGYRHTLLLRRRPGAVRDDLARAADVIGRATGAEPTLYRPPYGVFTIPALRLVRRLGWSSYLWSQWGRDWDRGATASSIAARVTRNLTAGDVVLLHDADHYSSAGSWLATAAAVPGVLDAAAQLGEPLVPLSQPR